MARFAGGKGYRTVLWVLVVNSGRSRAAQVVSDRYREGGRLVECDGEATVRARFFQVVACHDIYRGAGGCRGVGAEGYGVAQIGQRHAVQ